MKFLLPVFAGFAALAVAAPAPFADSAVAAAPKTITVSELLTTLTSNVNTHLAVINKTVAAIPAGADKQQKKEAAVPVIKQLSEITGLFSIANAEIKNSLPSTTKRGESTTRDLPTVIVGDDTPITIASLIMALLQAIGQVLTFLLTELSLQDILAALQSLLQEIVTLITNLGELVVGLLTDLEPLIADLGGILGALLTGLGL